MLQRKVVGSLGCMLKGRTGNKEVKKTLCNSIIVPTLIFISETWTCNEEEGSGIQTVDRSYLGGLVI